MRTFKQWSEVKREGREAWNWKSETNSGRRDWQTMTRAEMFTHRKMEKKKKRTSNMTPIIDTLKFHEYWPNWPPTLSFFMDDDESAQWIPQENNEWNWIFEHNFMLDKKKRSKVLATNNKQPMGSSSAKLNQNRHHNESSSSSVTRFISHQRSRRLPLASRQRASIIILMMMMFWERESSLQSGKRSERDGVVRRPRKKSEWRKVNTFTV